MCTAVAEAVKEPQIKNKLAQVLAAIDEALERRFTEAKAKGEISKKADVRGLASLTAAVLHSLAIRARSGEHKDRLTLFIADAVRLITSF